MIIHCPHCDQMIEILNINCRIFRCGVYIKTNTQVNPHESKENCDFITKYELIYGCGKPFLINLDNTVDKCEYI